MNTQIINNITYLNQHDAQQIDVELMDPKKYAFSMDQLMEMAGMSVAHCIFKHFEKSIWQQKILFIVGTGNNGGDGLVAARHLRQFGVTNIDIWIPKTMKQDLESKKIQCQTLQIPIYESPTLSKSLSSYSLIVDGIFGFSFDPSNGIREPFLSVLKQLKQIEQQIPILSIDIPSGWHVEKGPNSEKPEMNLHPQVLISLTAPKLCALHFKGTHYVGGRFVPFSMAQERNLKIPPYNGMDMITSPL